MFRGWNLPPTLAPCLYKVLLLLGRKYALKHNIDKPEWLFEVCANYLGFSSHLRYIIPAGVRARAHFVIQRKPGNKRQQHCFAMKITYTALKMSTNSKSNHSKYYFLLWFHESFLYFFYEQFITLLCVISKGLITVTQFPSALKYGAF